MSNNISEDGFLRLLLFGIVVACFGLIAPSAFAQGVSADKAVAREGSAEPKDASKKANLPALTEYRGVRIGMSAMEIRQKLGKPKETDKTQDLFVFSDHEMAQVFYDDEQKVYAISVDYMGKGSDAPTAATILGQDVEAKADGSIFEQRRYPDAGYWVSYNRIDGASPHVTVTMQKIAETKP
jgi:hypothetical protein